MYVSLCYSIVSPYLYYLFFKNKKLAILIGMVTSHCGFNVNFSVLDVKHLFMCLFVICMSSLVKSVFKSFHI